MTCQCEECARFREQHTQAAETIDSTLATDPEPRFNVGDRVTAIALPNAIPRPCKAVSGMVVESRRLIRTTNPRDSFPSYWRYQAYRASDPWHRIEGSERFFEAEPVEGGGR